jgi:hypothetical protein
MQTDQERWTEGRPGDERGRTVIEGFTTGVRVWFNSAAPQGPPQQESGFPNAPRPTIMKHGAELLAGSYIRDFISADIASLGAATPGPLNGGHIVSGHVIPPTLGRCGGRLWASHTGSLGLTELVRKGADGEEKFRRVRPDRVVHPLACGPVTAPARREFGHRPQDHRDGMQLNACVRYETCTDTFGWRTDEHAPVESGHELAGASRRRHHRSWSTLRYDGNS